MGSPHSLPKVNLTTTSLALNLPYLTSPLSQFSAQHYCCTIGRHLIILNTNSNPSKSFPSVTPSLPSFPIHSSTCSGKTLAWGNLKNRHFLRAVNKRLSDPSLSPHFHHQQFPIFIPKATAHERPSLDRVIRYWPSRNRICIRGPRFVSSLIPDCDPTPWPPR